MPICVFVIYEIQLFLSLLSVEQVFASYLSRAQANGLAGLQNVLVYKML